MDALNILLDIKINDLKDKLIIVRSKGDLSDLLQNPSESLVKLLNDTNCKMIALGNFEGSIETLDDKQLKDLGLKRI